MIDTEINNNLFYKDSASSVNSEELQNYRRHHTHCLFLHNSSQAYSGQLEVRESVLQHKNNEKLEPSNA